MGTKGVIIALLAAAAAAVLAGCHTVRGIGEDIEKGGEWIQRSTR